MRRETLSDIVKFSKIFSAETIYDFGGNNASYRAMQGYDITQVFSQKIVTVDKLCSPGVDVTDDLHLLSSFKDSSVNAGICSDVLEHVNDPPQVCRTFGRIFGTGGVLYVATVWKYPIHGEISEGEICDFFRFTPQGLKQLLIKDFEPIDYGFQKETTQDEAGVFFVGRRR